MSNNVLRMLVMARVISNCSCTGLSPLGVQPAWHVPVFFCSSSAQTADTMLSTESHSSWVTLLLSGFKLMACKHTQLQSLTVFLLQLLDSLSCFTPISFPAEQSLDNRNILHTLIYCIKAQTHMHISHLATRALCLVRTAFKFIPEVLNAAEVSHMLSFVMQWCSWCFCVEEATTVHGSVPVKAVAVTRWITSVCGYCQPRGRNIYWLICHRNGKNPLFSIKDHIHSTVIALSCFD